MLPYSQPREVGHRLTVSFVSLSVVLLTWYEPDSIRHRIVEQSGAVAWAFTLLMAVMACTALADVVVNDMMSNRYTLPFIKSCRMYAYMLQALMNIAMVGAVTNWHTWSWVAAIYIVIAVSSVWIAVADTYYHFIEPRQRASNT